MRTTRILSLLAVAAAAVPSAGAAQYHLRWVLAHEPVGVFAEAAKDFADRVAAETHGEIQVQIITAKEFGGGSAVTPNQAARAVATGAAEMTQTYTTMLSQRTPDLLVLDMPYLFRDHASAAKVLDGDIGRELLASLSPRNLKGLAFTYSGGYRILPTVSKEIREPEDLKGLRVRTAPTPVAMATFRALGAVPVPGDIEKTGELVKAGRIDAGESTLPRYADGHQDEGLPVINDTGHSLFLTAVLINQKFFESLPKADRDAISRAATAMARSERARSVEEAAAVKKDAVARGAKVVTLTPDEQARFVAALRPVYAEFTPKLGGLVERIQAAQR